MPPMKSIHISAIIFFFLGCSNQIKAEDYSLKYGGLIPSASVQRVSKSRDFILRHGFITSIGVGRVSSDSGEWTLRPLIGTVSFTREVDQIFYDGFEAEHYLENTENHSMIFGNAMTPVEAFGY